MAKIKTKAWRKNVSKSLTGRKLSEEHKKHIKENHWSKKGYISWNTGLTKETDERVRKNSVGIKEAWNNNSNIREKMSRQMRERRKTIIYPDKDTYIEVKIQKFLSLLHIEFYTHKYISEINHAYQCDILIPSEKLIIETDGCYWHGCKICNKKLNNYQFKQIEKDKLRTKELQEKGYKVIRLWEHDIKKMKLSNFKNSVAC